MSAAGALGARADPGPAPADLAEARARRLAALEQGMIEAIDACLDAGMVRRVRQLAALCVDNLPEPVAGTPPRGFLDHPFHPPDRALREEAEFWAAAASRQEIEAYLVAPRGEARALPEPGELGAAGARKRLFAALWRAMDEADQRAFLLRVSGGRR